MSDRAKGSFVGGLSGNLSIDRMFQNIVGCPTKKHRERKQQCNKIIYTEDNIPVRKLYMSVLRSPTDITKNALSNHFRQYGKLDWVTLHHKFNHCYGFVQFRSVHSAAAALQNCIHRIGRYNVKVSVADSWHQPRTSIENVASERETLLTNNPVAAAEAGPPPPIDSIQLYDLNDDCLMEIFTYLSFIDLCAIDQMNERFHRLAQEIFRKNHKAINLTNVASHGYSNVNKAELTLLQIRNLLNSFGSRINKLNVASMSFKTENRCRALDLIVRGCNNLNVINLTGFYLKEATYNTNSTFFANLEELTLSLCELNDSIERMFHKCVSLRKLTIQSDSNLSGSCLAVAFPRLESITLVMNSDIEIRHLYKFFNMNKQLKSIKIAHCGGCIYDEIFVKISTLLPNLESVSIEVDYFQNFVVNLMSLLRLEKLRELQLNCSFYSISSFVEELAAKDTIEVLHLSDGVLNDNLIDALVKCKRLTSLKLCSMPSVHNRFLVELAKNLPLLTDFHITKCQTLTSAGVLQFVNLASKLTSLNITNSSVIIDDSFFMGLVEIYKTRSETLTLNLAQISMQVTNALATEHERFVKIVRTNDFSLYDVYGDEFSELDDEYLTDDDYLSDNDWDDYIDFYDDDDEHDEDDNDYVFEMDAWHYYID